MDKTLATFDLVRLARGMGPTLLASGSLFAVLLSPVLSIMRDETISRVEIAGPLALVFSAFVFSFWMFQFVSIVRNRFRGVFVEGRRVHFFEWKFSSISYEDIARVELEVAYLVPRVCIYTTQGKRRVVLSNMMKGSGQEIRNRIADEISPSGSHVGY